MAEHVVVVGGGLAGITAALELADAGRTVTLLEAQARLGGSAFSFRRGELEVDNGQHVFLRCCTAYRGLLDRLGVTDLTTLQPRLDITVLAPGRRGRITRTPHVPAPLHLGAALLRYRLLPLADRLRAGRAVVALLRSDPSETSLDHESFGAFLRRHGQSPAAIEALWGLIGTATINAEPDNASLALAVKVFRTGLLERADAGDIGHAVAPLGDLHDAAARQALAAAGVEVLTGHRARATTPGRVEASGREGERTFAPDALVLAVPPAQLPEWIRQPDRDPARLGTSSIVNVHLIFDRRVTELPFAAAVGSPVQWMFDRTASSGLPQRAPRQQYLAITVSAADAIVGTPSRDLVPSFHAAITELLPAAARASLVEGFVTRERDATFRQAPGSAPLRAGTAAVDGVAVAGAWTPTGWPDTMESAVRSGSAAARQLLARPAPSRPTAVLR